MKRPYSGPAVNDDGWTEWVQPNAERYKMRCCDCNLVHVLQFRVVNDDGDELDADDVAPGLVLFRVRRDERATAASRRPKKLFGLPVELDERIPPGTIKVRKRVDR